MQSEMPTQEVQVKRKSNSKVIVLVVLVLALLGAGYWAKQTNDKLTAETEAVAALQSKYDKLKAEKAGLDGDLAANKTETETNQTDLEGTNATFKTTKSDLSKANTALSALQKEMTNAALRVDIMRGVFDGESTNAIIFLKLILIDDEALTQSWNEVNSPDEVAAWIIEVLESAIAVLEAAL